MGKKLRKTHFFFGRTQAERRAWAGRLFILPWLIGSVFFFLVPMIQTLIFSFNSINITAQGLSMTPIGFSNFIKAFTQDSTFVQNLTNSVWNNIYQTFVIICFAFFVALILRSKFPGRTFFRAVMFFPVIIASGVVITVLQQNLLLSASSIMDQQPAYMFQAPDFDKIFTNIGVPAQVLSIVTYVLNNLFNLTWKSGVQILLMLAALNNIPASSYEVADIEGATEWEKLWKITLPMVSPTLLVSIIYTIIDSFTDYSNGVMSYIKANFDAGAKSFGYASTIGIIYFVVVLIFIGVVNLLLSRSVYYAAD